MTYRDPLAGLRSQVATKARLAVERRAAVGVGLYALVPEALRSRLDAADTLGGRTASALADTAAGMNELAALDAALDGVLAAVDEALDLAPRLRDCPESVRDPPPPAIPAPWLFEDRGQLDFRRGVEARVVALDGDSFLRRWGDFTYLARLELEGARIVFTTSVAVDTTLGLVSSFSSRLVASIPRAFPPIELRPERFHHGVGKALGLTREITVGDAELDEAFFVTGASVAADVARHPRVRSALLDLRPARAHLRAGDGTVHLAWSRDWRDDALDVLSAAAIDAVLGWRAVLVRG